MIPGCASPYNSITVDPLDLFIVLKIQIDPTVSNFYLLVVDNIEVIISTSASRLFEFVFHQSKPPNLYKKFSFPCQNPRANELESLRASHQHDYLKILHRLVEFHEK
jgi:hypothetical protein